MVTSVGGERLFKVIGSVFLCRQLGGVRFAQFILSDKTLPACVGQLGQRLSGLFQVSRSDYQWRQIGVGKVTVVVGLFLASHRPGLVGGRVVQAGFLGHRAAVLQHLDLARDLELQCAFDKAKRIDVLEFCADAQLRLSHGPY